MIRVKIGNTYRPIYSHVENNEKLHGQTTGKVILLDRNFELYMIEEFETIEIERDGILIMRGLVLKAEDLEHKQFEPRKINVTYADLSYYAKFVLTATVIANLTVTEAVIHILNTRMRSTDDGYPQITMGEIDDFPLMIIKQIPKNEYVDNTLDTYAYKAGAYWTIDNDYKFHFRDKAKIDYRGDFDQSIVTKQKFAINSSRIRTRQLVLGGSTETGLLRTVVFGDGETAIFPLDIHMSDQAPTLYLSPTDPRSDPDAVLTKIENDKIAIRGQTSTTGIADWYWSPRSMAITQRTGQFRPPISNQYLTIDYVGFFDIIQQTTDDNAAAEMRSKIGGTGIIVAMNEDRSIINVEEAHEKATDLLKQFSHAEVKYTFHTNTNKYAVGDTFTKIDRVFIVVSKKSRIEDTVTRYTYDCISGAYYGDWQSFFKSDNTKEALVIKENEILSLYRNVIEDMAWSEEIILYSDVPRMAQDPNNANNLTLYPNENLYVMAG